MFSTVRAISYALCILMFQCDLKNGTAVLPLPFPL